MKGNIKNCGGINLNYSVNVLTNNSLIKEKYGKDLDITFVAGQYIDVLKSARDMVHKGSRLITHPLMGSIKPNETPFRSIIMSEGTTLDIESLNIIESSIAATEKFQRDNKVPCWNENVLGDFRFVDLKLFESALESIVK
ncbi:MAG TPA: GrdX family protein [Clostridia bacterium]|nr:GrdX family protein [Clostridia bacterium]